MFRPVLFCVTFLITVSTCSKISAQTTPKDLPNASISAGEVGKPGVTLDITELKVQKDGLIVGKIKIKNVNEIKGYTGGVFVALVDKDMNVLFPRNIEEKVVQKVWADARLLGITPGSDNVIRLQIEYPKELFDKIDPSKCKVVCVYMPKDDDWLKRLKQIGEAVMEILKVSQKFDKVLDTINKFAPQR